VSSRC